MPSVCDEVAIRDQGQVFLTADAECYSIDIAIGANVEVVDHSLIVWVL